MSLLSAARKRHSTKAFDPSRKIPASIIAELRELLRLAPSSVNSQPWHFVIAASEAAKARIGKAAEAGHPYNLSKITNASHVIVLCARTAISEPHLEAVLAKEEADGRFGDAQAKAGQHGSRLLFSNLHRYELKDAQHWMEKQVYLALGTLLLGAAELEVDAVPMEGFNAKVLDEELGLREQGFTSVVLVGLGYSGADDFNAKLPKSRLAAETIFTDL
ncbi:dihydropteridine reductase [Herbaspirillum rubrisubalbicans]|jgi:nitroreductase/dihydropteridine reductase|uniref:Oxygen-insensitive NAD(P)H-dependent nitroreductase NfsB n=1 Tax=Herbaspirillum rubrisubalbicans Os34 TaxID=1235827 RepID=A0A6M3ZWM6_9BURK|nr:MULTISPECIES: oxygen-insensitive NAD(P)H-dependent nitroreductase NfsB [Herbaspirillum]MCP1574273.1 nitroreductase/dihydropteridine reductase [Herbaspirillum rubrisubalbicans]NQE49496.1 dihydropteridine reductase [Herbaspirillum rubrisubalbicans]QJQ02751.1 oxygen-insensitive NAD(P)H-dependent nitroreductase NfsB [Herbaspirillum rubrisubalbicans Os34]RAN46915.1 dihydropteridine reductase [Herbaspirillum rubrisubalbicans]